MVIQVSAEKMVRGALNALEAVLEVGRGRKVLVVTDRAKLPIGRAFEAAARGLGADVGMYLLPEARPLREPPPELLSMVEFLGGGPGDRVFINAFSGIAEETPMRIALIKRELATGARVGHAPGITEEMMTEGPMSVDYRAIAGEARALIGRFEGATAVHVASPSGTDITLDIEGRAFETDLLIKSGAMGNLPAGEIWCAPVEDRAEGVIVSDGSIGDLGAVPRPVRITVERGRIRDISGGTEKLLARLGELLHVDDMADVIGELGIGLNPGARITGNLLEDEKAGGTAHIAFGNNTEMPGGKNTSKTHRDFLFHRPTIEARYAGGGSRTLIRDGRLVGE
ncbi:MAG: aminopeptidase [Thermoplasmatota archaeon]